MTTLRSFCLALLALTVACTGSITGGGAPGDQQPRPPGGTPGGGGAGGTGGLTGGSGPPPTSSCLPGVPWRTTTLTRQQYVNAASDLLGLDARALVTLEDVGNRKFAAGVSLTALQVEQRLTTAEALAAAATTAAHLPRLLPCDPAKVGDGPCAGQLIEQLGQRAFRRPLDAETAGVLRGLFDAGKAAGSFATGVEWMIAGILQSPDFLYHLAPTPPGAKPLSVVGLDAHALASRLAFFLWNSPPDDQLRAAAASGALRTTGGLTAQVERMLGDPRSARTRDDYFRGWLRLDDLGKIARADAELSPGLVADLQRSALQGIAEVFKTGAKVETLLSTPQLFANDGLARLYGLTPPGGTDLRPVAARPEERRGLLTHPAFLTLQSNDDSSDPIKRGLFIEEELLCQTMPDPPDDVPDLPALRPGLSTRARLEMHRAAPVCAACHRLFDPMGMALENYDSLGRYRKTDQGAAVDSSGVIDQGVDVDGAFKNGLELLDRLAKSHTVRDCMVKHWFEYAVSRHQEASDSCALEPLRTRFQTSGDMRDLLASLAQSEAFRFQLVPQE